MRSNGEVPANYLLEGLKEMAFVLGSWTRTKEVSSLTSKHTNALTCVYSIIQKDFVNPKHLL